MIIDHTDVKSVTAPPMKYDTPLIVNSDRIKAFPITAQNLQAIPRRLWVSNSYLGRDRELNQTTAVRTPAHIIEIRTLDALLCSDA